MRNFLFLTVTPAIAFDFQYLAQLACMIIRGAR